MEKVTLKLFEFYSLEAELAGVVNPQTGEVLSKGLLNEKIKLTTKFWLNDLLKKISEEKRPVEEAKQELVKKYGSQDESGQLFIPMYVDVVKDEEGKMVSGTPNPNFTQFQNEFNIILQEEKVLEYKALHLKELDSIESEGNYPTLFKLVKVDE